MELVQLTVHQLAIMTIYIILGYILVKTKVLTRAGSRDIAGMLVKLIIPAIIVNSFCEEYSAARLVQLGQSALLAVLLLGLSMLVSHLFYRDRPIENFASSFCNAAFMGIPLVRAVVGEEAVFFIVPFVALLNLLQWTYGVGLMMRGKAKRENAPVQAEPVGHLVKKILWNPPMVGIGIGLVLFVTGAGAHLPSVIDTTLKGVCGLNTPLAMMVLGVYLANEDLKTLFNDPALYRLNAVRLLLIPLLSLFVLCLIPFPADMRRAVLICAAAPAGANVAVYAQLYDEDYAHASKIVVLSTLLSLVTLPLIAALSGWFF